MVLTNAERQRLFRERQRTLRAAEGATESRARVTRPDRLAALEALVAHQGARITDLEETIRRLVAGTSTTPPAALRYDADPVTTPVAAKWAPRPMRTPEEQAERDAHWAEHEAKKAREHAEALAAYTDDDAKEDFLIWQEEMMNELGGIAHYCKVKTSELAKLMHMSDDNIEKVIASSIPTSGDRGAKAMAKEALDDLRTAHRIGEELYHLHDFESIPLSKLVSWYNMSTNWNIPSDYDCEAKVLAIINRHRAQNPDLRSLSKRRLDELSAIIAEKSAS